MPPRPALKVKQDRPVSAIYLGKGAIPDHQNHLASPPALPEIPEPPSPSSSVGSGLPSPPATNSTGSGSTGDPATVRERPLSLHSNSSASTSSGGTLGTKRTTMTHTRHSSLSSVAHHGEDAGAEGDFDDDYDNDNDNENNLDGDDTARLDRRLLGDNKGKEKDDALQRVKSLAMRNRMALDKLSSISRLSPSPARSGTPNSHSPSPSQVSSSSRLSQHPTRQPRTLPPEQGRSGSETERESSHHSYSNSTHSSHSSASSHRQSSSPTHPPSHHNHSYVRLRHTSAPGSPSKARHPSNAGSVSSSSNSHSSHSPSKRRNRASLASMQLVTFEEEESPPTAIGTARDRTRDRTLSERDMITQSALAAVASSRRSPLGTRRRSALPREFRSDLVEEGQSPANGRLSASGRHEDKEPVTPFRNTGHTRSSTLRDYKRSGGPNPRWSSDDFRSPATMRNRDMDTFHSNDDAAATKPRERRQSARGGSAESALWSPGGRSLLSEGLRAAGLSKRSHDSRSVALRSSGGSGDVFREGPRKVEWSPQDAIDESRRRTLRVERERNGGPPPRASTSMAGYRYLEREREEAEDEDEDMGVGREEVLSRHRSAYSLSTAEERSITREYDHGSAVSALDRRRMAGLPSHTASPAPVPHLHLVQQQDRASTASPFRRFGAQTPASQPLQTEHTRLLADSLTMFETQLAKVPPSSSTYTMGGSASTSLSASTHADLTRNAQAMVFAAEHLCSLLKVGAMRAVEAEVEAEVEGAADEHGNSSVREVWRKVGADYRDGGKLSDELVRGMTGFLLGCGKVMRDFGVAASSNQAGTEFGSPALHSRHASLSEDGVGGGASGGSEVFSAVSGGSGSAARAASGSGGGEGSGRLSVASRRSWEPAPRDRDTHRQEALRRLAGADTGRPDSVLARASPSTFQKLREREREMLHETPPPATRDSIRTSTPASGSTRRLFTPREQREQLLDATHAVKMATHDSQETVHQEDYEPSPTPASRTRPLPQPTHLAADRERRTTLTPLTIPKPLPTLPSERRQPAGAGVNNTTNARAGKPAAVSARERQRAPTVRGTPPSFPAILTPSTNATTALTPHTVSNNPDHTAPPLSRTISAKSAPSSAPTGSGTGRAQVTFSRPTAVNATQTLTGHLDVDGGRRRKERVSTGGIEEPQQVFVQSPVSVEEPEKNPNRRPGGGAKTVGMRGGRVSLDERFEERPAATKTISPAAHPADRSAATILVPQTPARGTAAEPRRERRRTVTDIWPRE